MFVVSINDNGQERNLVASDIRLDNDLVFVQAGGASHIFAIAELLDIVVVDARAEAAKSVFRPEFTKLQ